MHKNIQLAPIRLDAIEYGFQLARNGDVKLACYGCLKFLCQWFDVGTCPFIQPRNRDVRPHSPESLRTPIGDGLVVGYADNERPLAGKHWSDIAIAHSNSL